jgi:transposase
MTAEAGGHRGVALSCDGGSARTIAGVRMPIPPLPVTGLPPSQLTPCLWGFVLAGRMFSMPKAFPLEFRRDVVAVARKGQAPLAQVAKDFGVSEPCLQRWLKLADIEDGRRPGVTASESAELRELKKRNRLLEQENEVLRRAAAYLSRDVNPK